MLSDDYKKEQEELRARIEMLENEISYNYIGILPANLLYDIINGKAA